MLTPVRSVTCLSGDKQNREYISVSQFTDIPHMANISGHGAMNIFVGFLLLLVIIKYVQ